MAEMMCYINGDLKCNQDV